MFKIITIVDEEFGLRVDRDEESDVVTLRLNDYLVDEEKSTVGNTFYKENKVLEVYRTVEEVKEIIKALQQILPEEEANE